MRRRPAMATLIAVLALFALPNGGLASGGNTRITSGPSGTIFVDSATFTFSSPLDGGFECRLDAGEWDGCSSPKSYSSLSDGWHVFRVRALNRSGHPDPTPAVATFQVIAQPPETTIVSGAIGTIVVDVATFDFESSQPGGFQCRLDSQEETGWDPCISPKSYSSLAEGDHIFEVRAINEAGKVDPTPAAASFAVEPETTIDPEPSLAVASFIVDAGPPDPVAGKTLNLEPLEGTIQLQCPGEDEQSRLTSFKQIPVGCLVNTRQGVVGLTASKGSSGELQDAKFWGGVFIVSQEEGDNQEVDLKLAGRRMCERRDAKHRPVARTSRKGNRGRKLWGSGKGNYQTSGSYGSATVRGTTWLVVDRCDSSTLFKVAEGKVWVEDFVKDKSLTLGTGEQYLAKAALPRLGLGRWP